MSGLTERTEPTGEAAVEASRDGDAPVLEPTPDHAAQPVPASRRERGHLRRRLRFLRRLRELQLRDLGGLVFDLYRFGEQRNDLVRGKLDALIATDRESRDLEARLEENRSLQDVRVPAVGGACWRCGTLHGTDARFCSACGAGVVDAARAAASARRVEPDGP
jgi:hypothetical protein